MHYIIYEYDICTYVHIFCIYVVCIAAVCFKSGFSRHSLSNTGSQLSD